MENRYQVRRLEKKGPFRVTVPGSKSMTNRALMLAALSDRTCRLSGVLFSDDSRAFLDCLVRLGFRTEINENDKSVTICGTGGRIPRPDAALDVRSAGTAARFLTVMLAFAGGDYEMTSSEQMAKRPMEPLLSLLERGGAQIEYRGERGHFPFVLHAHGVRLDEVEIDTSVSSQFASALLMAGTLLKGGLRVRMTGSRTSGSYIRMTLAMMEQFGIAVTLPEEESGHIAANRSEETRCQTAENRPEEVVYRIAGGQSFGLEQYAVEPDLSGASYFYSLAPLLGVDVLVRNVHRNSMQGDIRYVELLQKLGCSLEDSPDGLWLRGSNVTAYPGLRVDMKDFSDQTMTLAALAVYAGSVTEIVHVGHIRAQETDRMAAIISEMTRMGIRCEEIPEEEGIRIYPGKPKAARIQTYGDHRMAMAFTLVGLRADGIEIEDPSCCGKTFENYFDVMDALYEGTQM